MAFRTAGNVTVLALQGELDAHTAPELETAIQHCKDEGTYNIIVSGAQLDYISSAGLGVFMAYIEEFRTLGGDIKIAALQPKVFNVFDLLGFPLIFSIAETEDEAVEMFSKGLAPN